MRLNKDIREWNYLPLLLVFGWLAYAHTLEVPFYFDDNPNIVESPGVHLTNWSLDSVRRAVTEVWLRNRPLAYLSFATNFYFGRYEVAGYHLVNIALHLGTGALLYWLVQVTLVLSDSERRPQKPVALLVSLIWLLHPLQTQTVTYIVQRMTGMTGFFYLAALCLYVAGRRQGDTARRRRLWFVGAVAWGCALASKEIAITLPAAIWLYEWCFFQEGRWRWSPRFLGPIAIGMLVLVSVAFVYTGFNPLGAIASSYGNRDFSLYQRLITQPRVVLFYVTLVLWPQPGRLSLLHPVDLSQGLLEPPETLAAISALVAAVAFGFWMMRKDRLVAFALFWFLGHLVVESSVIGLELIFEHRLYLPTMFAGLALYRILHFSLGRWNFSWPVLLAMGYCCVVLGFWTVDRNQLWTDPVAFWEHTLKKFPDSARARTNLAVELVRRKDFQGAIIQLEKALILDENMISARMDLAGAKANTGDDEGALAAFENALELTGGHPDVLEKLTAFHALRGRLETASDLLRRGLERHPRHAGLLNQLGMVLVKQNKPAEAREHFEAAIAIDPGFFEAHDNLGQVLFAGGQPDEAIGAFQHAIRLCPNNPRGHFNLGYAYEQTGRFAESAAQYQKVLKIDPADGDALYRTGFLLVGKLDRFSEGIQLLRRALQVAPEDSRAAIAKKALAR